MVPSLTHHFNTCDWEIETVNGILHLWLNMSVGGKPCDRHVYMPVAERFRGSLKYCTKFVDFFTLL